MYLSKSKYCGLWQCPKIAWLNKYKPEEAKIDGNAQNRRETGDAVGDLAMGLFGDYVDVTAYDGEKIDISKMISNTVSEMRKGTRNICEASFSYNGLYCAVDILRKADTGWSIFEVKSSVKHQKEDGSEEDDKEVYIADIAFQKYVLENSGVNVVGTYLVCVNGDYVFNGTLDLNKLFFITDVGETVNEESKNIEANIIKAEEILKSDREPAIDIHEKCNKPYNCVYWQYCTKTIPERSVFDLYRLKFTKKIEYYRKGWISYSELLKNAPIKNVKQRRQLEYGIDDKGTYVNKEAITKYLASLSYPLYFLDFETVQYAVPKYVGTKPYAQIPFQYSLHYIEKESGEILHNEFLGEPETDPRRALAEQLCMDIPMDVCVTAYNKAFECSRIKELADVFPDLAEHLLNIKEHIVDLLIPFQSGWYYNRAMGGSFSIKSVLPAIFPDDPELNYHNLEEIHNGSEAMSAFPKLALMTSEERERSRHNLLKYCELDTFAMVKVWQELVRVAKT